MKNKETQKKYPDFIIYETEGNVTKVSVRLEEETVWLSQKQLAEIPIRDPIGCNPEATSASTTTYENKKTFCIKKMIIFAEN